MLQSGRELSLPILFYSLLVLLQAKTPIKGFHAHIEE